MTQFIIWTPQDISVAFEGTAFSNACFYVDAQVWLSSSPPSVMWTTASNAAPTWSAA